MDAAARAFGSNGYHRTSLDDIAQSLAVTKPTLYYYTKNKEDLLEAVIARALAQVLSVGAADPHATGLEQLKAFLRRYSEIIADDYGRCLLQLSQSDLSEATTKHVREKLRIVDRRIRALLRKGVADGSIAPCDIRMTSFMLAAALNGIPRWFKPDGRLSIADVSEIFVNQMLAGLLPRKPSETPIATLQ